MDCVPNNKKFSNGALILDNLSMEVISQSFNLN